MTEAELPDVMTVEECAEYLHLNRKTVYKMVQEGMPGAQVCRGTIRIRKKPMLAWFDAGEVSVAKRKRAK